MTGGTRVVCIGGGAFLALTVLAGCAQQAASSAAASAATAAANAVVDTAAGAVNAVGGGAQAATGTQTASGAKPAGKRPRIKSNGRGGYDASELQKAALANAHAMRDRYGVINRANRPTTQPSTPANR